MANYTYKAIPQRNLDKRRLRETGIPSYIHNNTEMSFMNKYTFPSPRDKACTPSLIIQKDLWGESQYLPICHTSFPQWDATEATMSESAYTGVSTNPRQSLFSTYLNRHLLPKELRVEGKEEIPCVEPYTLTLPENISGIDERTPENASKYGMHGFCYDNILMRKWRNMKRVLQKARHYHCVLAPNFTVPMDGYRCEAVEAIRYNRVLTICFQQHGIPTIQTVSLTSAKFFDIAYDGLASRCPVAFENMCVMRNREQKHLFRLAVEKLIERKSPTVLVVVGYHLDFDPQIPVVYYESRIQKLRRHGYNK